MRRAFRRSREDCTGAAQARGGPGSPLSRQAPIWLLPTIRLTSTTARGPPAGSCCAVSWFTLESRTAAIGRATVDGSVARTIAKITRAELIVIDDIGMLPAGQAAGEAFHRVVDAAYGRRSIAVTFNLHPSGCDTIMPKTLATATVDRLFHHAHVVLTEGTSLRLSEATAGRGVMPLNQPPPRWSVVCGQGDQLSAHREVPMLVDITARSGDVPQGQLLLGNCDTRLTGVAFEHGFRCRGSHAARRRSGGWYVGEVCADPWRHEGAAPGRSRPGEPDLLRGRHVPIAWLRRARCRQSTAANADGH